MPRTGYHRQGSIVLTPMAAALKYFLLLVSCLGLHVASFTYILQQPEQIIIILYARIRRACAQKPAPAVRPGTCNTIEYMKVYANRFRTADIIRRLSLSNYCQEPVLAFFPIELVSKSFFRLMQCPSCDPVNTSSAHWIK